VPSTVAYVQIFLTGAGFAGEKSGTSIAQMAPIAASSFGVAAIVALGFRRERQSLDLPIASCPG